MTNLQKKSLPELKTKLGILCVAGVMASVLAMFFTSLDDILFVVAFVFAFLAIILLSSSGKLENPLENKLSKWVMGDKVDPSNPFNIDRRYSK